MTELPLHYDKTIRSILRNRLHNKDLQLMSVLTMATYDDDIDDEQHKVVSEHHKNAIEEKRKLI